jgi:Flp pilus assembly protein TadG
VHRSSSCLERIRRRLPRRDATGSAAIEFIFVGVIMLVPLVYLIVTLGLVQGQMLGVAAGARHIARAIATAPDAASADRRAREVRAAVISDYGLDAKTVELSTSCLPRGAACPSPGATIRVTMRARVALPLVPDILGLNRRASIRIESRAVQHVSQFWGTQ